MVEQGSLGIIGRQAALHDDFLPAIEFTIARLDLKKSRLQQIHHLRL